MSEPAVFGNNVFWEPEKLLRHHYVYTMKIFRTIPIKTTLMSTCLSLFASSWFDGKLKTSICLHSPSHPTLQHFSSYLTDSFLVSAVLVTRPTRSSRLFSSKLKSRYQAHQSVKDKRQTAQDFVKNATRDTKDRNMTPSWKSALVLFAGYSSLKVNDVELNKEKKDDIL